MSFEPSRMMGYLEVTENGALYRQAISRANTVKIFDAVALSSKST